MELDYNKLTKDALYKILLHVNDVTTLTDEEIEANIWKLQKEKTKRKERRENARNLDNSKKVLIRLYELLKPKNISFEEYKKIVDSMISSSIREGIKFPEFQISFSEIEGRYDDTIRVIKFVPPLPNEERFRNFHDFLLHAESKYRIGEILSNNMNREEISMGWYLEMDLRANKK